MIGGRHDARFEAVRDAFHRNFAERGEIGASLCIYVDGRAVVDLWGGYADQAKTHPWRPETLVAIFSVGKAITALCAHQLVDRGKLDLDAPVSRYWPEFAAQEKAGVTIRQLLSHRAGLPAIREPLPQDAMLNWSVMTKALAGERPWWPPGSRHGYHVNTFGYLVGEVVRRITGRSLGSFVSDEIAGPLGADFYIGLAQTAGARIADFVWGETPAIPSDEPVSEEQRMIRNAYVNPPGLSGIGWVNWPAWRAAEIPSTNGHATARGVARIYAALAAGGSIDGVRIIGCDALGEAVREHSAGYDAVLKRPSRFGLGFQLARPSDQRGAGGYLPPGLGPAAFGHLGVGGSVGFADPDARVAFGYVMNAMGPRWNNPRPRALIEALYDCL
ncbi:MAG: serine hydrolase domain-containing protein [Candidatus Binataceae bacterium]